MSSLVPQTAVNGIGQALSALDPSTRSKVIVCLTVTFCVAFLAMLGDALWLASAGRPVMPWITAVLAMFVGAATSSFSHNSGVASVLGGVTAGTNAVAEAAAAVTASGAADGGPGPAQLRG